MLRFARFAFVTGLLLSPALLPTLAHAQTISRYWVSRSGDDTANCSLTTPCRFFSGALVNAASGSEINCLDAGPYGQTTITKGVTINCEGVIAGIRYNATGITINAGATDNVVLRGLSINGDGTETTGIKFNSGRSLVIENSFIFGTGGTNGLGVAFNPTGASFMTIINTTIAHNGNASGGGGIQLAPASGGFGLVQMENVRITNNYIGIGGGGAQTVNATVSNSTISNNRNVGVSVSGGANVSLTGSTLSGNGAAATSGNVTSQGNNTIRFNSPDTAPPVVSLR